MKKITIIDYGAGNLYSVKKAVARLGLECTITNNPEEIASSDRVIFPGVGQASAAMLQLKEKGLDTVIPTLTMPVLGICLGMQLMCKSSQEENTTGLGIFPVEVLAVPNTVKVPHMGWNNIASLKTGLFENITEGERMYFVHSYYVPQNEYTIASCRYHDTFSAAVKKDNFYGCQFHPEKSSKYGELILENFINGNI